MSLSVAARAEASAFDAIDVIARTDMARLSPSEACGEATRQIAAAPAAAEDMACVVDQDGRLVGLLSLKQALAVAPDVPVSEAMSRSPQTIGAERSAEEAAHLLHEAGLSALPVVDVAGKVVGLIPALAAHRYLVDQHESDADDFVGIVGEQPDDYMDLSVLRDFGRRIPWVLGLAVAGLAAGYVVHVYEDALDALVILALYMPMVADTGGNVGTQSASLVTRALSFGDVKIGDATRIFWREARVALLMAATLFLFAYLKVLLISNAADVPDGLTLNQIGLAIAVALAAQVVSATLIGAVLPVLAVAARQDPAVVSGPALTTIVDLSGLILYFGIVTYMLELGDVVAF